MRYDAEMAVAQMVADYLTANVASFDASVCPIVTFFDPMSIDEANRVVVMVPSVSTDVAHPGSFVATVEVGIKSRWAQESVATDFENHFGRSNDVRDKLMVASPWTHLTAPAGIGLHFVQPVRQFSTRITEDHWIYSDVTLTINGWFAS